MFKITKFALIASFLGIVANGNLKAQNDPVVITLGHENITLSEFEETYLKNNNLENTTEKDLREYIDLFVNFRLKCAEAKALHLDTISRLKDELEGYRNQAAAPYLTEKSVNERLIDEGMENIKWDVRASHIMKKLPLEPQPKDTLKVYKEMIAIRNRILKGENFNKVAVEVSEDPSARPSYDENGKMRRAGNRGDLGYFTAFNMIYEFENAAYNTKVGEISMPIRSQFGYHLIYLQDKQPALKKIKAAQILITYPEKANAKDSAAVREKAEEAYKAIKNGMSFEEAVDKYCTDEGLRMRKGVMDAFSPSRFEGDFISPIFQTEEGDITKPFETRYGWHIVEVMEKHPVTIDKNTRGIVKSKLAHDSRSSLGPEALVKRLKKEYNFKETIAKKGKLTPLQEFYSIDSAEIVNGIWKKEEFPTDKVLFTFADQKVTQRDFAKYIEKNQFKGIKDINMEELVNYAYSLFVHKNIIEYENTQLEKKYPEFRKLMEEYRDGVILYELSERKIWNKAEIDSTGLENFYHSIQDEYMYPVRANSTTFTLENGKAYKLFCKLKDKKGLDLNEINKIFSKKHYIISIRNEIFEREKNADFDLICPWDILLKEKNIVVNKAEEFKYIEIEKLDPSPKPLSEVKGIVISRYQDKLEKEWIKELHENNKIDIDYNTIFSLIK